MTMPFWKHLLLNLYYEGSRPYRWCETCRAARRGMVPIAVLFYHRVADEHPNDWTVSNAMFARQIEWLASRFEMISLGEVQRRLRAGRSTRPAVSITFDDGYSENCRRAIPLMIERRIPCTCFATLHNILTGESFRHDAAAGCDAPPNTLEQLRAMADAGIEIGAHGRRHVDLAAIRDPARLFDEVVAARDELADALGRPIRYFAFPFGQYESLSSEVFALARESGYEGVCSAYGGYNVPGDDPFHLQRIHVDNDMIRLKNRSTVDRRKIAPPRFRWSDAVAGRPVPVCEDPPDAIGGRWCCS
jgi:peptidoglycan/xylan/chitin deacetylase (PgdA/CDA1 family)